MARRSRRFPHREGAHGALNFQRPGPACKRCYHPQSRLSNRFNMGNNKSVLLRQALKGTFYGWN